MLFSLNSETRVTWQKSGSGAQPGRGHAVGREAARGKDNDILFWNNGTSETNTVPELRLMEMRWKSFGRHNSRK